MSLQPPKTAYEAKFQYCNYGFDRTIFSSFGDCMSRYYEVFPPSSELPATNTPVKSGINWLLPAIAIGVGVYLITRKSE